MQQLIMKQKDVIERAHAQSRPSPMVFFGGRRVGRHFCETLMFKLYGDDLLNDPCQLENDIKRKVEQNQNRLHIANTLIRELRALGVVVQNIDIAVPRPRLYLKAPPPDALPLRGVKRRRIDTEVFECAAILDDCEVIWAEFEDEVAA